jgi:hypothetical protein
MKTNSSMLCLVAVIVLMGGGEVSCSHEMPAVCNEFFALPVEQQDKAFANFSINKQLDVYHCGMQMRPPLRGMAYEIAKGGEKIIPDLLQRLTTEKSEWMQYAIIDIFRVMSNKGSLRGRQDVMYQIKQVVSQMKIDRIKEDAQEALNTIEKNIKAAG